MASDENVVKKQTKKEKICIEPITSLSSRANDESKHKRTFRGAGLYIAANAEFRKCIIRNRGESEVAPITLDALLNKVPEQLVLSHYREKTQPNMSFEMKNTLELNVYYFSLN